jgi:DNA-binding NtrC family response regulator
MMERGKRRNRLADPEADPCIGRNVLILDQNSFPCAAQKCGSLAGVLQRSLAVSCTQAKCDNDPPGKLFAVPDLIVLRTSPAQSPHSLIASCKQKWSDLPVLTLYCARFDQPVATPIPFGCDDFSYCPFHEAEFLSRVHRLLKPIVTAGGDREDPESYGALHFGALVGKSKKFLQAVNDILPLARCDATVLVCGETGTGKELFSRAIHYQSPRQGKPFIPVNCAALPDHLFENELFGHVRGAYTDASSAEKGLIAEAEGGTLVLDEIGSLGLAAQAKLLRFLQDGEYRPLGASRSLTADVRIIAATNEDLSRKVRERLFREDLYYRLNSLSVSIPPLRERIEDIALLANYFLRQYAKDHGQQPRRISDSAFQKIMAYHWPGNVRELEGVMLRAMILTASATLQPYDIHLPAAAAEALCENTSLRQAKTGMVRSFERMYLINLLTAHHGNVTKAAKAAGKQRRTLQRLLQKYSLNRQSFQC